MNYPDGDIRAEQERNCDLVIPISRGDKCAIAGLSELRGDLLRQDPADVCVGPRQNNVGERLAKNLPLADRQKMLLAAARGDLNEVSFRQAVRSEQDWGCDGCVLVESEATKGFSWRGRQAGNRHTECSKGARVQRSGSA